MQLYLGQWERHTRDGDSFWRPPDGDHIGALDLRSLVQCGLAGPTPEGYGLFVYAAAKTHANLVLSLGDDLEKSGLWTFFGVPATTPMEDRLRDAIRQWLLDPAYYDAGGQTRWKPLRCHRRRRVECRIGGVGQLFSERFDASHPAFAATEEVFRADYVRNREVRGIAAAILRKWTGATCLKLYGEMSDSRAAGLLPATYRGDGWAPPDTTISDNFNRPNESLDVGPWTEVVGDWSVTANEAALEAAAVALARHTTQLSSDDHKSKVTVTALAATGRAGPVARFSTDASPNHDCYRCRLDGTLNDIEFFKIVDGTETLLDTPKSITRSLPDDLEIEVNGSTMVSRFNGATQHNFTDTSLTGQLNCGMQLRRTADRVDDFLAEDLPSAAFTPRLALLGVGR